MNGWMTYWLQHQWRHRTVVTRALLPLAAGYCFVASLRRGYYRRLPGRQRRVSATVIVVGNLSMGGTGKTPMVMWLAEFLKAHGHRPGVISRGHGGGYREGPQAVPANSDPELFGDEPVLMAERLDCPIVVGRDRVAGAEYLLRHFACRIILADDGLQHYRLARDIEILMVDGENHFGNGYCLPAGPLRESPARAGQVDFVVANRSGGTSPYAMDYSAERPVGLRDGRACGLDAFRHQRIHAVAGLGNPQRFFDMLTAAGLTIQCHAFPDHHRYRPSDLDFNDALPVLMTAKDAVKCRPFAKVNHWYMPIEAQPSAALGDHILHKLEDCHAG